MGRVVSILSHFLERDGSGGPLWMALMPIAVVPAKSPFPIVCSAALRAYAEPLGDRDGWTIPDRLLAGMRIEPPLTIGHLPALGLARAFGIINQSAIRPAVIS
ncbi:hypothetical protein [Mesorhizobium sp. L-8-10]|uniref:hypothetical protein n=1 Tax=Mesorhizobium sp. L-8-10 TaxID=2744523 RepID=UPI001928A6EA|nr:hypothetical protein [Mesorhizobium sp. L-8-10]